ncbi:unnamed protein product [Cunninghamella echinulata]
MFISCSDTDLYQLSKTIQDIPITNDKFNLTEKQQITMLTVANLKSYISTDGSKLIRWSFSTLLNRLADKQENSGLGVLFDISKQNISSNQTSVWVLCLIGDRLPQYVIPTCHRYLITQLANIANPITTNDDCSQELNDIILLGQKIWDYLLNTHSDIVKASLLDLLNIYLATITSSSSSSSLNENEMDIDQNNNSNNTNSNTNNLSEYVLGYLLSLPKISPRLTNECWSEIFCKLYANNNIRKVFLKEKQTGFSRIQSSNGELVPVISIFSKWLTEMAFDPDGVIMKHALDVAIILDTIAFDSQLGYQHLIPSDGHSVLDNLLPSFDKCDISTASIDLIDDWIAPILNASSEQPSRHINQLKIPVFFLQYVILKSDTMNESIDLLIKIMSKVTPSTPSSSSSAATTFNNTNKSSSIRYILQNIIDTASKKWIDFYKIMFEQVFLRAMTMNIARNDASETVEKILGNLSILYSDTKDKSSAGFSSFSIYMATHWQQVMLLFLNHPSKRCQAYGYSILTQSLFWKQDQIDDSDLIAASKVFIESWFRHIKSRYHLLDQALDEPDIVSIQLKHLVIQCCQHEPFAKILYHMIFDSILNGSLEIFPRNDISNTTFGPSTFLDVVNQDESAKLKQDTNAMPRYIPNITLLSSDLKASDKIYIDNINQTVDLFIDSMQKDTSSSLEKLLLTILSTKLTTPSKVSLEIYEDSLPNKIPYTNDITNGNAFKNHPALFLILDHCLLLDKMITMALVRSIFIYFIAFWNMGEVINISTTLQLATQLEETIHLFKLMASILPDRLQNIALLFPFLSSYELGQVLYTCIWPCVRLFFDDASTSIPGLESVKETLVTVDDDLVNESMIKIQEVYKNRMVTLKSCPSWVPALQEVGKKLGLES